MCVENQCYTVLCESVFLNKIFYADEFSVISSSDCIDILETCLTIAVLKNRAMKFGLKNFDVQLDSYVLIHGETITKDIMISSLYEYIAPIYEEVIDITRNIENIETLLIIADKHNQKKGKILLDYGCGTGLSRSIVSSDNTLYGYEPSYSMGEYASLRGINVISREDLEDSDLFFDVIFSSYVFHLDVDFNILAKALSKLTDFGIFVCNIHKGSLGSNFVKRMESVGLIEQSLASSFQNTEHGKYVSFKKRTDI
jgi:hypothetical protein